MGFVLKVAESGRLNLPSNLRKQIGLEDGGPVSVWIEDGEIRIKAVRDVMAALQAEAEILFGSKGETVDRFLADRRAEAKAEDEQA
jgi:bifunctional DNA-binding transcriptional regulator/antitoxin component of YhaV-PrlF toxin-antitoxin module